jgi:malonate transporter and related proteins
LGAIVLSAMILAVFETSMTAASGPVNHRTILKALGTSLLRSVFLAPIVGITFSLVGIPLPNFIKRAVQLIGQASGGLALFLAGLILSAQPLILSRNVISSTLMKNTAQPLVAFALVMLMPITNDTGRATLLMMALPSGFFGVLFGLRYGVAAQEVGSTLIVSSPCSVITLSTVLILTA